MSRQIVIVGGLLSMTRADAKRVIEAYGGSLVERVSRTTSRVIVGDRGPQTRRDGGLSTQLARARRLLAEGCQIEVLTEEQWLTSLQLLAGPAGIYRHFTAGQIAEALAVPRATVERWLAAKLVHPVDDSPVPRFDFSQVVAARTLADLATAGVGLIQVCRGLRQLQTWMPGVGRPLVQLCLSQHSQRLVIRTTDGRLAETSGQLLMDFEQEARPSFVPFERVESHAEAFDRALAYEEDERLHDAAEIYREMLQNRGPDPAVHFNLGNALYGLDDLPGAMDEYRLATSLDPQHAAAWNNLANILAELDQLDEATEMYQRALVIDPARSDSHFNLAQTLVELDRPDEAALHWRAYLAFDPESTWADYALGRLSQMEHPGAGTG